MEDALVGQRLGPYQLHEVIGRGGMGVVYRASQPSIGRDVAIKVIGARYARHPSFIAHFEREARAVAGLQHPHILPVHDVGVAEGQPYLVTAYLTGGTLARRIAAHPGGLPLEDVLRITAQIAAALDHAHHAGIIHCDLKPGNVLLDQQGNAYLADFGIARIAQEAGLNGRRRPGTREYTAPEVAAGAAPGPASDIYALGLIVFEMLAGRRPFQETPGSWPEDRPPPNPLDVRRWRSDLPRGVSVAIEQVLGANPEARPPQAGALALSLALASGRSLAYRFAGPEAGSLADSSGAAHEVAAITPVEGPGTDPFTPPPLLESPALDNWLIPTEHAGLTGVPTRPAPRMRAAGGGSSPLAVVIAAVLVLQLIVLFVLIVNALGQSPAY